MRELECSGQRVRTRMDIKTFPIFNIEIVAPWKEKDREIK